MRLLLVDSDKDNINSFREEIERDYVVDVAYSGQEGVYLAQTNDYDVIVLDTPISDIPDEEVCKNSRIANAAAPIIVLAKEPTALARRIPCLDSGADVFLAKPVASTELCAQVRALLRRSKDIASGNIITKGPIEIDLKRRAVRVHGVSKNLRRKEYDLLVYMLLNQGRVVSKEEILEHVWYESIYVLSNTVEVHVRNLRKKLEDATGPEIIKTVRGFGYEVPKD
jgi:DNA-binding response OmpR family regulator